MDSILCGSRRKIRFFFVVTSGRNLSEDKKNQTSAHFEVILVITF